MAVTRNQFTNRLADVLSIWRTGLLLDALLRTAGTMLLVVLAYGALDYFLALGPTTRAVLSVATLAVLLGLAIAGAARVFGRGMADAARHADGVLADERHSILTAWELNQTSGSEGDPGTLGTYLRERQLAEAARDVRRAVDRGVWPKQQVRRSGGWLLAKAAVVGLLVAVNFLAALTIAGRLLVPWADIPPYSPLQFAIEPRDPRVVYGDGIELKATLTGAPVTEPVTLLTRRDGVVRALPCFQVDGDTFSQRLDHITEPVEFSFATGKARSRWLPVDVLLLPRISLASVTVYAPAYTGQPNRSFLLGRERLEALENSRVRLAVTSNRPLHAGKLILTPTGEDAGEPREIDGRVISAHTVGFEWTVREDAEAVVEIRDVRGTRNDTPFTFSQKVVPDRAPEVAITAPKRFSLATPDGRVPLHVEARDDMQLQRVELMRARVGYRDRGRALPVGREERTVQLRDEIRLADLGVRPGDTLELYLEAADHNPTLLGVSVSEPVRIQVITHEEYAERRRQATSLEDFVARYNELSARLARQREAARELHARATDPETPEKELAAGLEELRRMNKSNRELFQQIAEDYPVFEMDKSLKETASRISKNLANDAEALAKADASKREELAQTLEQMDQSLAESGEAMAAQQADAEELARIGELMRQSARFMALYADEQSLARRAERFTSGTQPNYRQGLTGIAARQRDIQQGFDTMLTDITKAARELGPAYRKIENDAMAFVDKARDLRISEFMGRARESALALDGNGTGIDTQTVVKKMKQLLEGGEGDNSFCQMCQGQAPGGNKPGMQATMQQMLANMLGRGGSGGSGGGPGGPSSSGYWARGNSMMEVPVYGPQSRPLSMAPAIAANESADAGANPVSLDPNASAVLDVEKEAGAGGERLAPEAVPDKYRDAVKRYFTPDDEATP